MIWVGALQKTGSFTKLEPYKGDVRAVTVHTHTFVLGGKNGLADDREDLFYTAAAQTPEEAEAQAHAVYLRAVACPHQMKRQSPMLLECPRCGVQQRTPLAKAEVPAESVHSPQGKTEAGKRPKKSPFPSWFSLKRPA